mmetsp:Transcript_27217/g.82624  ORF Transcript_27217/g.82624 Transcript_27217/m.82624 type:complete len:100 (-) Transcript_27217:56-355(-)|eukprot:scaffold82559_cov29-Tisochrysis_lutea.AAC.4
MHANPNVHGDVPPLHTVVLAAPKPAPPPHIRMLCCPFAAGSFLSHVGPVLGAYVAHPLCDELCREATQLAASMDRPSFSEKKCLLDDMCVRACELTHVV